MSRHEWKCQQCGRIEKTGRDLAQHIKDAHQSRAIVPADEQDKAPGQPLATNHPPAAILELNAEEAKWLDDTLTRQSIAGLTILNTLNATEGALDRPAAESLVRNIELVRGIRDKLKGKEG